MTSYRQKLYGDLIGAGYNVDFVGSLQSGGSVVPLFDLDHEGHSGYHAAGELSGKNILPNVYNWLGTNPADVALLHIGTNDISAGGQSAAEVEGILNEIDRYSPDITVVLARIINRTDMPAEVTTQFNDAVETMATNRIVHGDKILIVDQEAALNYIDDMDGILHPNAAGYAKMAAVWMDALNDFLPVCGPAAPVITSSPLTAAYVGLPYTYNVDATGNPSPTYSFVSSQPGMTISPTTGLIQWTPAMTGVFDVTVQASNSEGIDNQNFSLQVYETPPCPADIRR